MSTPPSPGSQPEQPDQHREGQSNPPGYPPGYPQQSYPPQDYPQGYPLPQYPAGGYPQSGGHQGYPGAGAPPDDPLVPADFGGWFRNIIGVVRRGFPQLALLQVITAVISAVYGAIAAGLTPDLLGYSNRMQADAAAGIPPDMSGLFTVFATYLAVALIGGLISVAVNAFVQGASVFVAIRGAAGAPAGAAEGLRFAAGRALPLIGWWLLAVIMVSVGSILLLIPGLYLMVVLYSSLLGVIVVERDGIGRCFTLIQRRFWISTGRLIVAGVIFFVYYLVAHAIAALIGGGPTSAVTAIVQAILVIPLGIALTGVAVVMYAELRLHEQGTASTPALNAEMSR